MQAAEVRTRILCSTSLEEAVAEGLQSEDEGVRLSSSSRHSGIRLCAPDVNVEELLVSEPVTVAESQAHVGDESEARVNQLTSSSTHLEVPPIVWCRFNFHDQVQELLPLDIARQLHPQVLLDYLLAHSGIDAWSDPADDPLMERVTEAELTGAIRVEEGSVWKLSNTATPSSSGQDLLFSQLNPTRPKLPALKREGSAEDDQEAQKVKPNANLKKEKHDASYVPPPKTIATPAAQAESSKEESSLWKPLPSPITIKSASNSNSHSDASNGETEVSSNGLSSAGTAEPKFLASPTLLASSSCVLDELQFLNALLDSADRFRQFLVTDLSTKLKTFREEPFIAQMLREKKSSYRLSHLKHTWKPRKDSTRVKKRKCPEGFPKLLLAHGKEVETMFMNWLDVNGGELLASLVEDIEISTLKRLLDPHRPCDFDEGYFQVKLKMCARYASNVFQAVEWCVTFCRIALGTEEEVRSCLATQPLRIRKQLMAYREAVQAASKVLNQLGSSGPHLTRGNLEKMEKAQTELSQTRLGILKKLAKIHGEGGSQNSQSSPSRSSVPVVTQTPKSAVESEDESSADESQSQSQSPHQLPHPDSNVNPNSELSKIILDMSTERNPSQGASRKRSRSTEDEEPCNEIEIVSTAE